MKEQDCIKYKHKKTTQNFTLYENYYLNYTNCTLPYKLKRRKKRQKSFKTEILEQVK